MENIHIRYTLRKVIRNDCFMANIQELIAWYGQNKVAVVIDEAFPLAQTSDAVNKVLNRKVKGKLL